ncbi:MAG: hypothetical protein ACJ71N_07370 [Terriglobales bacterium]
MQTAGIDAINNAVYLYLRELSEPRENSLRIVIEEAAANRSRAGEVNLPGLAEVAKGAATIESVKGCRTFEITWRRYVAYLVTEEAVGSCGKYQDEEFTGRFFRTYKKSHFLELLGKDTGGHQNLFTHHKIICLNHLIDVASSFDPVIGIISTK